MYHWKLIWLCLETSDLPQFVNLESSWPVSIYFVTNDNVLCYATDIVMQNMLWKEFDMSLSEEVES